MSCIPIKPDGSIGLSWAGFMVMGIFVIVPRLRKHVVINSDVNCNPGLKNGIEIECSFICGCRYVLLNHVHSVCCDY